MNFLNPLPIFFWLIPLIPILIFFINRRKHKLVEFSSIRFLLNLKTREINKLRLLNILLLIIRIMILIIILFIVMRPSINNLNLPTNLSDSKISNIILIDDSFSNQYGKIYGEDRKSVIEGIINDICDNYPIESNLKVIDLNKGVIFDGYNDKKFNYSSIKINNSKFFEINNFLNEADDFEFKNLHIISNSNKYSIKKNRSIYNSIKNKDSLKVFYHYLPESSNNQYISNIKLINNIEGLFYYQVEIGNDYSENIDLVLSANQNLYSYNNSKLSINQTTPILSKNININANSSIVDTIPIQLQSNYFMEILFNLKKRENNLIIDLVDDRIEDNTYSYIMNLPNEINISVFYNNKNNMKYIKPALETFQLITSKFDSSFLNINYIYSEGVRQYSNSINNKDILIFLGYDIFLKSDFHIFSDFLYKQKSQIIIFPTKNDIIKDNYIFNINDSLVIENSYIKNYSDNYDKVEFLRDDHFLSQLVDNNNFKLNDYFFHALNKNTILTTNENHSIWSRYKIGDGYLDLFGFLIDYGNNFFNSEITYSIPLLYSIIIDEKINSTTNNLLLNQSNNTIAQNFYKSKLINIHNDSIIFHSSKIPTIHLKNLNALIHNEKLIELYSFNPSDKNFNNNANLQEINLNWPFKLITYSDSNFKGKFSDILYNNEITIYFIYFLILLILIEIYLSNAKSSKSS